MDKSLLGQRIKQRRRDLKMTQSDIANAIGVAVSTVQRYEKGAINKVKLPVVDAIARAICVSPDWLYGRTDSIQPYPFPFPEPSVTDDVVTFYPIGTVAAGYGEIAYEEYGNDPVDIPRYYLGGRPKSDFFVLTVHGNSMYPAFLDGDKVLVLKQSTLNQPGSVGVILYESENATLKKIEYVPGEDWLRLVPINPEYPPKTISGSDLELCRVLGIPRLLIREM